MLTQLIGVMAEYGWAAMIPIIIIFIIWKMIPFLLKKEKEFGADTYLRQEIFRGLDFHPLFKSLEYRIMVEVPSMEIVPNKPVRQSLFRDILHIELETLYDACVQITKMNMTSWSSERWRMEIKTQMNSVFSGMNKKMRNNGVPDAVIHKYARWHRSNLNIMYHFIDQVSNEPCYSNNEARTITFFLTLDLMIKTLIADAERNLRNLNGEIGGLEYKGEIIES